jgi:hypothetical protein
LIEPIFFFLFYIKKKKKITMDLDYCKAETVHPYYTVNKFNCVLVQNSQRFKSASHSDFINKWLSSREKSPNHFFFVTLEVQGSSGSFPSRVCLSPPTFSGQESASCGSVLRFTVSPNSEFFTSLPSSDPATGIYKTLTMPLPMCTANRILVDLHENEATSNYKYVQGELIKNIIRPLQLSTADVNDIIDAFSKRMPKTNRGSKPKLVHVGDIKPPGLFWRCKHGSFAAGPEQMPLVGCSCEEELECAQFQEAEDGQWQATFVGIVPIHNLTKQLEGLQKKVIGRSVRASKIFGQQRITAMRISSVAAPTEEIVFDPVVGSDLYEVMPPKREATKRKRETTYRELEATKRRTSELERENQRLTTFLGRLKQLVFSYNMNEAEVSRVLEGGLKLLNASFDNSSVNLYGINLCSQAGIQTDVFLQLTSRVNTAAMDTSLMLMLKTCPPSRDQHGREFIKVQLPILEELPADWITELMANNLCLRGQLVAQRGKESYTDPSLSINLDYGSGSGSDSVEDSSSTDDGSEDDAADFIF